MTAADKILQKALVGSTLDSRSWNGIQAALRDRAFFSSTVAEMKILHAAREMVAGRAAGNLSASEIRRDLRKVIASTRKTPGERSKTSTPRHGLIPSSKRMSLRRAGLCSASAA